MKNFDVGAEIKKILEKNEELTSILIDKDGVTRIFPIIAEAGTMFPFVTYKRVAYTPNSTKDYRGERVFVDFAVCSTTYAQGLNIANMIANTLERYETTIIDETRVTNLSEDYIYDTYVQYLSVEMVLKE